eukprot:CAMPEP_0185252518 /NCGR_PEP_ID=MMETSP1359-20130426/1580_1 /TAXON_ID=552665 /ORGANISM="Bigelowiella longifila, Strain CCMP242" /LENGTH=134 /DNA_ID=CAMNT_0027834695 /DNA_START=73 /DNA_END=477 /DNA_ORIENTATION=+
MLTIPEKPPMSTLDDWKTHFQGFTEKYFIVNGYMMAGSIAALPNMITYWDVKSVDEITPEKLKFIENISDLEVLIIGTGKRTKMLPIETVQWLRNKRIGFEMVPSGTACATFNFMCEENREIAALILPMSYNSE